jgi:hypothetical protein
MLRMHSMNAQPRIPFHSQAEACAFSGTFHCPILYAIKVQAATSPPTLGGHARSRVENFPAEHLVRVAVAHCCVPGNWQDDEIVTTHSTAAIEGLNILDLVIADRIVSRRASGYRRGEIPEKNTSDRSARNLDSVRAKSNLEAGRSPLAAILNS